MQSDFNSHIDPNCYFKLFLSVTNDLSEFPNF